MVINHLKKVYPDPANIFKKESATLKEALQTGIIVLDTNTLLLPYNVDSKDLQDIKNVFQSLKAQNRLFVPAHVAREFAQQRAEHVGNILKTLQDQKSKSINWKKYSLFSQYPEYQKIIEDEKEILTKNKSINDSLSTLISNVLDFERNDPVSVVYQGLFDATLITDHNTSDDDFEKDLEFRNTHLIPPGYKDKKKGLNADGDLHIWHTILNIGQNLKNDLVFISHDKKPDWQNLVSKIPFQPRYELIDEYRRASDGKSFHIATLNQLLDEIAPNSRLSYNIQNAARALNEQRNKSFVYRDLSIDEQVELMINWFYQNYEDPAENTPFESAEGGYQYIWGGPYEVSEELGEEFSGKIPDSIINVAIEKIEDEFGYMEWAKKPVVEHGIWVDVEADWETGERCGAAGTFQVVSITDSDGNNYEKFIDQGYHYHSVDDVLNDLSERLKIQFEGDLN